MDPNAHQPQQQMPPVPQQELHQEVSHSPLPKALSIILGVLILLALVGGAYYLGARQQKNPLIVTSEKMSSSPTQIPTPTIDPTANWLTYPSPAKFTQESFTLKYPPTWKYKPALRATTTTYTEDVIMYTTGNVEQNQLTIDTISNPAKSTAAGFAASHQSAGIYPNLSLDQYIADPSVVIPGADLLIDRKAGGATTNESVLLTKGDTAVLLTCMLCSDELTNQILSTFKFTQ